MGFFKEIGKFAKNIGKAAKKVAAPAGMIAGTIIGGPAGASIGGQIGGLLGSIGGSSGGGATSVPEVSSPYMGANPNMFTHLPSVNGINGGVTMRQDGTVDFGNGTVVPPFSTGGINYGKENAKIFGSPTTYGNGNSSNSATPLLFGFGALMLLSD